MTPSPKSSRNCARRMGATNPSTARAIHASGPNSKNIRSRFISNTPGHQRRPATTCFRPLAVSCSVGAWSEARRTHARRTEDLRMKFLEPYDDLVGGTLFPDSPVRNVRDSRLAAPKAICDRFLGPAGVN